MDIRNKKFAKNGFWSVIQQGVAVACGLILPQFILSEYGSSINGTLASITQFISFITLLQGGVGTIARIAYYKPLAEKNDEDISIAYKTISSFFRKFSIIFSVYLLLLAIVYPLLFSTGFSFWYIFWLVIVVGLASISEYFFGQSSQLLLYSDQKGYIYSIVQIICLIISTILGCILIKLGFSIHIVKLIYSIVFAIRPIVLYVYVKKHYKIDYSVNKNNKLLEQKNSALVRHIAFYIHTSTDVMVITFFLNALWVSVYSVHRYVINCLSNFLTSILGNSEVVFGDMFAKGEKEKLRKNIPIYDLLTKYLSVVIYTTCIILISSFVQIYTKNVNDINYYYPIFATILVLGEMIYCMGITYQNVYISAGHLKKTEWIAVIEALINILISVFLVRKYGILGVAIGTLVAMLFKTIANMYYMQKYVIKLGVVYLLKSNIVSIVSCIVCCFIFLKFINYLPSNYFQFFSYGLVVFLCIALITFAFLAISFKDYLNLIIRKVWKNG
ncbi:MAG: polysaccharide biosynthesis C-terminal domain-containing protein [Clostridia bacterium]|nr:polysaccharide biosynthesis C-terminal domain-containing protein [Clostridia bacterium]